MKRINKVAILSDENTTKTGKVFANLAEKKLVQKNIKTEIVSVDTVKNIADAVYQFDRIGLEIKPDLLIVTDFACIGMQSPEEEPLYNNMTIPIVHVLFRRPWEYKAFMVWRCNFTNRFYMLVPDDVVHVKNYYPKLLNVKSLQEGLFTESARMIWSMEQDELMLEQSFLALPAYMKTIATRWEGIMEQSGDDSEEEGLKRCLREIGFTCSDAEYLDILYMMQSIFALYYIKHHGKGEKQDVVMRENIMKEIIEDFLNINFPVSLL